MAVLEYNAEGAVLAVRCQKDARHGHGKKRTNFHYHRWDGHAPDGAKIKLTWDGIGIMPEELARARAEAKNRPPKKHGELTWDGDE